MNHVLQKILTEKRSLLRMNNDLNSEHTYRLDHLNEEEKNKLTKLLKEFDDIQYSENEDLTITSVIRD